MTRVLAVCLGNICRSPAAEAAIRRAAAEAGIEVEVDSAGTGDYHVGEPPNPRVVAAGAAAGLEIEGRARRVTASDFDRFDLIVVMDRSNQAALRRLAPHDQAAAKIRMFRSFDPEAGGAEVPDPYYGTDEDYRYVIEVVEPAARGLVSTIAEGRL